MSLTITTPVAAMEGPYRRRWAALAVLCLSLLIIVMANTSLMVAAPELTRDLQLSSKDLQWVIDAYTVPYAALMLMLASIGDRYSRRGTLIAGLLVFAGGAILGASADTSTMVLVARAVMGTAAAMIMPATLSLLVATFPAAERTRAITVWTATSGLAIAAGPLLSGALLNHFSWPSTFLVNVPIALGAIVLAFWLVPPSKAETSGPLDFIGGALSTVGLAALVYAIIEGSRDGWIRPVLAATALAAISIAAFILWELQHASPLLDLRKFRDRAFSGANLAVLLFFMALFAAVYFISQHLQFVLGYGALETGVRLLPMALAVFIGAAVTAVAVPRLGRRFTIVAGMFAGTASLALLVRIDRAADYLDFVGPLVLLGVATGLSVSPCTDLIMDAFPPHLLGVGGAVNDTSLELGGSMGIAVLGSLLATGYTNNITPQIPAALPPEQADFIKESIGGALAVTDHLAATGAQGPATQLQTSAFEAFSNALSHSSIIGAIILGVGTAIVGVLLPGRRHHRQQSEPYHNEQTVDAEAVR